MNYKTKEKYRNNKLLELAKYVDTCMACGNYNCGNIVAAHSNQLRDGKARSTKAHDFRIAYLCYTCHMRIDQGKESREERQALWEESHRKSIGWLFEKGHLEVK